MLQIISSSAVTIVSVVVTIVPVYAEQSIDSTYINGDMFVPQTDRLVFNLTTTALRLMIGTLAAKTVDLKIRRLAEFYVLMIMPLPARF